MKRILYIILFLGGITTYGQIPLEFTLHRNNSIRDMQKVNISLVQSNNNKKIFELHSIGREKYISNYSIDEGKYIFLIDSHTGSNNSHLFKYEFDLTGKEIRIEVEISLDEEEKYIKSNHRIDTLMGKSFMSIAKIFRGSENVFLIPVNKLSLGEEIDFKIINNTAQPIYGYYRPSLFYGELFRKTKNVYKILSVGRIDLNVSGVNNPLMPHDTSTAFVPDIYNSKGGVAYLINKPGLYRFRVYYSLLLNSSGYGYYKTVNKTKYWLRENTLFEKTYDFNVK